MNPALDRVKTIVYLHGFVSSPQSRKAVMLGDYLLNCVTGVQYLVPELPHRPAAAFDAILAVCSPYAGELTLVGSSLGGFYATVAAERLGCRAALLNPAVRPHCHFDRHLGPQRNMYTGESFVLTRGHIDELRALDVEAITRPERYWLFLETGDEVLDYREAVAFYAGALHPVGKGGDPSLTAFPAHIPDRVDWVADA